MLYLKPVILNIFALPKKDLTLTSVVFETNVIDLQPLPLDDLTLVRALPRPSIQEEEAFRTFSSQW